MDRRKSLDFQKDYIILDGWVAVTILMIECFLMNF